jgi:RHS repeat-associated protein
MAYGGGSLRESRTIGQDSVTFTWDVNLRIPQVMDDGSLGYVYGLGRISQVASDDTTYYYLSDGPGSVMALTDADGDVVNTYDYDVFGAVRASSGSQPNEFRFTGEQWDDSTGLEYLRARYHDAGVGRFMTKDPFAGLTMVPQSLNRYAYVLNNPLLYRDPYGYFGLGDIVDKAKDVAGAVGEGIDAASQAVKEYALPVMEQCAIWGVGGAVAGGLGGAAAGCAAGGSLVIVDAIVGPSPVTGCLDWGAAGYIGSGLNPAVGVIGCVTGAASYYAGDSPSAQCAVWLAGGFASAKFGDPTKTVQAGVAGCLSGAASLSASRPTPVRAGSYGGSSAYGVSYGGKE